MEKSTSTLSSNGRQTSPGAGTHGTKSVLSLSKRLEAEVKDAVKNEFTAEIAEGLDFVSSLQRASYKLLHAPLFEHFVGAFIMLNFFLIVYETDHTGGVEETPHWIRACYWFTLALFVLESTLRLMVLRSNFWLQPLNVWDLAVVCVDLSLSVKGLLSTDAGVVGISAARFLRLLRLARATKALAVFPELRLMMGGLKGAFSSICWGAVFLLFALVLWAVLAVQLIQPLNLEVAETGAYADCERCPRAYETVWQAALTFTTAIVCGDSWARETVPIIEHAPVTVLFFVGVFLSVGMALMNLILGVVVNAATEARDHIAKEISDKKALRVFHAKTRLLDICAEMDADGSGMLSRDELQYGFQTNQEFKEKINTLGIHTSEDLELVWSILDADQSGDVSFQELVAQIYSMKNSETAYLLAYVKFYVLQIRDKIEESMHGVHDAVERKASRLEEAESIFLSEAPKELAVAAQDFRQVEMRSPYNEQKKQDVNAEDLSQQLRIQSALLEVESVSASSKLDMALGEQLRPSLLRDQLRPSPDSLLSQLQALREHYLTSSENLQRSHDAMVHSAIQTILASTKGSGLGPPPSDVAAWLRQKTAEPSSRLTWDV